MATAKKASKQTAKKASTNRHGAASRVTGKSHAAHPEDPTDSSVKHAEPVTGRAPSEGQGGYPAGEYDITPQATATDPVTGLPIGAVIEHEALHRWRVHVPGQNRYGHGATEAEAITAYLSAPN
jgi:hypothetical protein